MTASYRPHPIALLSAVLLYVFLAFLGSLLAIVFPILAELLRTHPRLAMLGFLGVVLSPVFGVAFAHRATHAVLDTLDRTSRVRPRRGIASLWAGLYAWLVIALVSSAATLVVLVVFPPEPSDGLVTAVLAIQPRAGGLAPSLYTAVWIALATGLYEIERLARAAARLPNG